jgi:hypothetical protein
MQPVLEEHGENNLGPEIDTPAANVFIKGATAAGMQGSMVKVQRSPISKIIGVRTHTMMSMIHHPSKMLRRMITSTKRIQ